MVTCRPKVLVHFVGPKLDDRKNSRAHYARSDDKTEVFQSEIRHINAKIMAGTFSRMIV